MDAPTLAFPPQNRRQFPRFQLEAAYAPMSITRAVDDAPISDGHVYDVSEGGLRFEADEPIAPGTAVDLRITLPTLSGQGDPGAIRVRANVVWIEDLDDPAPYRMAAVITAFATPADRDRLLTELRRGLYRAAA